MSRKKSGGREGDVPFPNKPRLPVIPIPVSYSAPCGVFRLLVCLLLLSLAPGAPGGEQVDVVQDLDGMKPVLPEIEEVTPLGRPVTVTPVQLAQVKAMFSMVSPASTVCETRDVPELTREGSAVAPVSVILGVGQVSGPPPSQKPR